MKTLTYHLLVNLSVSDLMISSLCGPVHVVVSLVMGELRASCWWWDNFLSSEDITFRQCFKSTHWWNWLLQTLFILILISNNSWQRWISVLNICDNMATLPVFFFFPWEIWFMERTHNYRICQATQRIFPCHELFTFLFTLFLRLLAFRRRSLLHILLFARPLSLRLVLHTSRSQLRKVSFCSQLRFLWLNLLREEKVKWEKSMLLRGFSCWISPSLKSLFRWNV